MCYSSGHPSLRFPIVSTKGVLKAEGGLFVSTKLARFTSPFSERPPQCDCAAGDLGMQPAGLHCSPSALPCLGSDSPSSELEPAGAQSSQEGGSSAASCVPLPSPPGPSQEERAFAQGEFLIPPSFLLLLLLSFLLLAQDHCASQLALEEQ